MNLASLLGGACHGGFQSRINPLAGVLGGSTGLLGTSGVPYELAGLCALLGNQQSHNVSLTNLQVVELQHAGCGGSEASNGEPTGCGSAGQDL